MKNAHHTLALGLRVFHSQEDIQFSTFKGDVIFLREKKMTACLPDCLTPKVFVCLFVFHIYRRRTSDLNCG